MNRPVHRRSGRVLRSRPTRRRAWWVPVVTALLAAVAVPALAEPEDPTPEPAITGDEPIAITTKLTPDPSNVGDLLEYEVVAAYPRGYSVNVPSGLSLGSLYVRSVEEGAPEVTGAGMRKVFRIELQVFEVGETEVPQFRLTYVTPDGEVETVDVPARPFTVESLLANEADPQRRAEDPPISLTYPNTLAETIVFSVLGTLLAAAVFLPIVRAVLRRKRVPPAPPPVPPHELAYAALEELGNSELLEGGQVQEYYVRLTEIAKGYLEGRFGVLALDHTTEEIRRQLMREHAKLGPLSPDEVIAFLHRCDLVKFARFDPKDDEAGRALEEVRTMVDRTESERAAVAKARLERARRASTSGDASTGDPGSSDAPAGDPPTGDATAHEERDA